MEVQDCWVIVPAFNEGPVIGEVVAGLRERFAHVVVVDDGSADDCGAVARASGAILLRHPFNLGQGAALQTGINVAEAPCTGLSLYVGGSMTVKYAQADTSTPRQKAT